MDSTAPKNSHSAGVANAIAEARTKLLAAKQEIEDKLAMLDNNHCRCGKKIEEYRVSMSQGGDGKLYEDRWICWSCYLDMASAFTASILGG